MGNYDFHANQRVEVTFEVEMVGSGTAGGCTRFWPFAEGLRQQRDYFTGTSVTYAPVSSSFDSVIDYYFQDGVRAAK